MSLEELTHREPCYAAMRLLTETAWRRNMTVEALLTLTELLDPTDDTHTGQPAGEERTCGPPGPRD
ncbi:hypothetical protein [Plantactinospora sp. BB1]|uniref:hypothetical protein n=1 Tax=Plantactinospora sp. BB1 TaxID=2071627 RepID=UPI00131F08FC|nr:hypothetical protein [Plantactinospora sp. BB1]